MDECIEWPGAKWTNGYGAVGQGRGKPRILAHRFVYQLINGPLPDGIEVRHTCDNPPCVNPRHLIEGTHAENMADIGERGRWRNQYRVPDRCGNRHELTLENTRIGADKRWHCRTCDRANTAKHRAKT